MSIEESFKELRQAQRKARLDNYHIKRGDEPDIIAVSPTPRLREDSEFANHRPVKITPRDPWLEEHSVDISHNPRK